MQVLRLCEFQYHRIPSASDNTVRGDLGLLAENSEQDAGSHCVHGFRGDPPLPGSSPKEGKHIFETESLQIS